MNGPALTESLVADNAITHDLDALPRRMEEYWDEPAVPADLLASAHDELQGAWFSVSGRREGELLISGHRFTFRFTDGDIYMGVFDLNPEGRPRWMDMHIDEGPSHYKGKTALCIYVVEKGTLRWCAASPGQTRRLTDFPAEDASLCLHMVFRREPPT
jgi:uncharacterized protein (TIGR03067 family)